jgi:hypothetical protein
VSLHTAIYRNARNGHRVLVEHVHDIRRTYLASREFICDLCGVLPLQTCAVMITWLMRRGRHNKNKKNLETYSL